jgi:hypothetical protein
MLLVRKREQFNILRVENITAAYNAHGKMADYRH